MTRRQRNTGNTNNNNNPTNTQLNQKIDDLGKSIDKLVQILERMSTNTQGKGGVRGDNPFIRPNSRRSYGGRQNLSAEEERRNFKKEWSQYYSPLKQKKKWSDMSDVEREDFKRRGKERKEQAKNYVRRSNRREELYNDLASSRFGSTSVGRFTQNILSRNQRIDDYSMMGRYMQANAGKMGKGMFGNGKAASVATKALGGFGKALGGVSKLLGGPVMWAFTIFIEGLKLAGKVINEWNAVTSKTYEHQTKQEKLQYELSKQEMLIENQMKIENISAQGDLQLKMIDAQGATMLEALKITTGQYAKSVEIALGPLTKGINESAYDAAMARIDAAAEMQKLGVHKGQRETEYGRYAELRGLQQKGKLAGLEAEKGMARTQYKIDSQQEALAYEQDLAKNHYIASNLMNVTGNGAENRQLQSKANGTITNGNKSGNTNVVTGQSFNGVYGTKDTGLATNIHEKDAFTEGLKKVSGTLESYQAIESAKLGNVHEQMRETADYNKASVDMQYQLATTQKEYATQIADKQLDIAVQEKEIVIDTAAQVKKQWIQLAQTTEKYLENFDKITNDLGINMGYTNKGQLKTFQKSMFKVVEDAASKFGLDIEEAAKMQQTFVESTGRNKIMGETDYSKMFALGKYLGDNGLAASYASEMEIFNASVSDSVDMLDEALQDVNRMGLNGRKYTKTLVDNLKLAQKYNFKGGTKGLMNMAKWAENTRFNLASLGGMIDKVHEGGLEGVITQGAQLQVLGGHAAMGADPIAMMYEAYADPEAYAKRMQDMTKGFGQLDRKTGETKFSGNEVMMMEQIAKAQGRSLEDVQNEVRARNKKEVVSKQLGGNFNEEQQSFISNNATYNKETGRFEVKVLGANGQFETKDVSNLTKQDLENIMPERHEEKMEKYMEKVVSAVESMKGEEIAEKANIAAATYEEMLNAYAERTRIAHESYAEHREQYIAEAKKGMQEITGSFQDYIGIFKQGNEQVDASVKEIKKTANSINSALNQTAEVITAANAKIAAAGGIGYDAPTTNGKLETQSGNKPHSIRIKKSDVYEDTPTHISTGARHGITVGDGILNNNNQPIMAQASKVTKVQDGTSQFVKSDRKDSAIFAKQGGPFDKLFNGVIGKVNKISNFIGQDRDRYYSSSGFDIGNRVRKNWDSDELGIRGEIAKRRAKRNLKETITNNPIYKAYSKLSNIFGGKKRKNAHNIDIKQRSDLAKRGYDIVSRYENYNQPIDDYMDNVSNELGGYYGSSARYGGNDSFSDVSNGSGGFGGSNNVHFDTLNVEINGTLELSSDGNSVNIMDELRNNPILLRSLSRMLTEHISSAMNGGRGISNFAIGSV